MLDHCGVTYEHEELQNRLDFQVTVEPLICEDNDQIIVQLEKTH